MVATGNDSSGDRMSNAGADVAIVGFGFSGLATLMNVVRTKAVRDVVVICDDDRGLGLAYDTSDLRHSLNVQSDRMGAWADEPRDFARWLTTAAGLTACREMGVAVPGDRDFAPRALYARYLSQLRAACLLDARSSAVAVRFVNARAIRLTRSPAGWLVKTTSGQVSARRCVLATGHDRRPVFGDLNHAHLHAGPWRLTRAGISEHASPVALIGSGLTAVDSTLTLRRLGYDGEIVALSRNGRIPAAHRRGVGALELSAEDLARLRSVDAIIAFIRDAAAEGHDWRSALDALRPHSAELWQSLSAAEQREAVAHWMSTWGVLRHRMPPAVAEIIHAELRRGSLRVIAATRIRAEVTAGRLTVSFDARDRSAEELRCAAVVDCTGSRFDLARSDDQLLRDLIESGVCRAHQTGLALAADRHLQVAEDLYALGGLLTGQLWESIAVPELRGQAARIAAQIALSVDADRFGRSRSSGSDLGSAHETQNVALPSVYSTKSIDELRIA